MNDEKKTRTHLVLIVEDQEMFADYVEEILRKQGYTTVSFREPFKALDFFVRNAAQVDIILTDIVMPYMDGIELARRVARIRRETPVILLSAYSEQLADGLALPNVRAVLVKPVLRTDLMQAIEGVIRSREHRRGAKQL